MNVITTDLVPEYASVKSFYGKAKVLLFEDYTKALYSYTTRVLEHDFDGIKILPVDVDSFSATTNRHINEYLEQCGKKKLSKKEIIALSKSGEYIH